MKSTDKPLESVFLYFRDEEIQMDACIMDGRTMNVGSITGIQDIYHPITLARKVMEKTPYNFLGSKGATELAKAEGFKFLKPGDLVSDYSRIALETWKEQQRVDPSGKPDVRKIVEGTFFCD